MLKIVCPTNLSRRKSFIIIIADYVSLCAKSLLLIYPIPFLEFCPKATPTELTVEVCLNKLFQVDEDHWMDLG